MEKYCFTQYLKDIFTVYFLTTFLCSKNIYQMLKKKIIFYSL